MGRPQGSTFVLLDDVIDGNDDAVDNSLMMLEALDIYSSLETLCEPFWAGELCVFWCDLIIDYLRVYLSFAMCKSNALVDRDVSKQKQSILKIKTMMVSPIKLDAIS